MQIRKSSRGVTFTGLILPMLILIALAILSAGSWTMIAMNSASENVAHWLRDHSLQEVGIEATVVGGGTEMKSGRRMYELKLVSANEKSNRTLTREIFLAGFAGVNGRSELENGERIKVTLEDTRLTITPLPPPSTTR